MNRLVIVGNSDRIVEQRLGAWIDSHPMVLRMNWGFPLRHPDSLGRRTDILAVSCDISPEEIFREYDPRLVIVASPKHECFPRVFDPLEPLGGRLAGIRITYPKQWWGDLYRELGDVRPSTGAMMLYGCIRLGIGADIVGFDFLKTKSWYNEAPLAVPHVGTVEERFAMDLVQRGHMALY
jgi:hypothetical protein